MRRGDYGLSLNRFIITVDRPTSKSGIITQLQATKDQLEHDFQAISDQLQRLQFDPDKVEEFWEQPYAIVERKPDEWYVIAPTFVDFQIGWLEKTVKGWNYFVVNKYMHWLALWNKRS